MGPSDQEVPAPRSLDYFTHLRLHFQFLLSPIFLWGYLLAGGQAGGKLLLAYLAFHLFGYAGGTALNSYYDRDQGPIGGLSHPPPVPARLLEFSLAWQAFGFLLALLVNLTFAVIYAVMFLLSLGYSHPRTRWKGNPLLALLTVALGQGLLAFLGGWSAARGGFSSATGAIALAGAATATLLIVGFYPLTESYQMEEDAARGDRTLAVSLGAAGSFRWAIACLVAGGVCALFVAATRFSWLEALLLVPFLTAVVSWITLWSFRFRRQTKLENYTTTMRLYAALTLPFLGWIALHLFIFK